MNQARHHHTMGGGNHDTMEDSISSLIFSQKPGKTPQHHGGVETMTPLGWKPRGGNNEGQHFQSNIQQETSPWFPPSFPWFPPSFPSFPPSFPLFPCRFYCHLVEETKSFLKLFVDWNSDHYQGSYRHSKIGHFSTSNSNWSVRGFPRHFCHFPHHFCHFPHCFHHFPVISTIIW